MAHKRLLSHCLKHQLKGRQALSQTDHLAEVDMEVHRVILRVGGPLSPSRMICLLTSTE